MAYLELYSDEILDKISLGKTEADFNPNKGDYVKVEVIRENEENNVINTFYSNKLLLKNSNTNSFYIGDYHYHPENGFMEGTEHSDEPHSILLPIPKTTTEPQLLSDFNSNIEYKKQINIYYDDKSRIYIKPTELLEKINAIQAKYKLKIYFLRSLKTSISSFLKSHQNNLIENGNFFAGLEATQAGDLDRSLGHNRFVMLPNPGDGRFVLEQNGAGNNSYTMNVTGIEPNSNYILSGWVGFNNLYDSNFYDILATFDNASSVGLNVEENNNTNYNPNTLMSFELQGSYHNGWPHTTLTLNGAVISDFNVVGETLNQNSGFQNYDFPLPSLFDDAGMFDENTELEIGVKFDNDAWGGGGANSDRNLYFKSFTAPSGRKFTISTSGNDYLIENNSVIEGTSVLYYNLNGTISNHYNFPGEFRQNMFYNGEIKVKIKAGDFFNLQDMTPPSPSVEGLILQPTSNDIMTDMFSSYKITSNNNTPPNRNLQIITIGDIVWYKRFKLISTTSDADLGFININLGKNHTLDLINSNTLGRRFFTDLRFEKVDDLNTSLLSYINNLMSEYE